MQNIQTQPRERGPSPNITTLIEFKVPLPEQQLYCPALAVTVYDQIFMGFSQPKLGNFTIPIGEIMHDNLNKRAFALKTANYIIEKLEAVLDGSETGLPDVTPEAIRALEEAGAGPSGNAINGSDDGEEAKIDDVEMDFEGKEEEAAQEGGINQPKTPKTKA